MLERMLKPIAFTEQAAAVAARGAGATCRRRDREYRDVVAQGATYSGTEYIEAGYRRDSLRASFLELFEQASMRW